jgi:hypothetical protein
MERHHGGVCVDSKLREIVVRHGRKARRNRYRGEQDARHREESLDVVGGEPGAEEVPSEGQYADHIMSATSDPLWLSKRDKAFWQEIADADPRRPAEKLAVELIAELRQGRQAATARTDKRKVAGKDSGGRPPKTSWRESLKVLDAEVAAKPGAFPNNARLVERLQEIASEHTEGGGRPSESHTRAVLKKERPQYGRRIKASRRKLSLERFPHLTAP